MKSKKLCSKERLASPRPRKPRTCLRWSPTGRTFDLNGKLIQSSDSECQFDISESDNACASNHQEPTSKRFPNSTSFLGSLSKFFMGIIRFGNDHVAAILGYGNLKWGNILIAQRKSKTSPHKPKHVPNSKQRLHLLHMDLYGPMRVESINRKRYVLVIVDDYSRYTWVHFLRSKDEAPENDREDIGKLGAKAMAFEQRRSKPELQGMTSGRVNATRTVPAAPAIQNLQTPNASTTTADSAPTPTNSSS
ncbi:gag-pol polyprotein [Tanacetum coccineum]